MAAGVLDAGCVSGQVGAGGRTRGGRDNALVHTASPGHTGGFSAARFVRSDEVTYRSSVMANGMFTSGEVRRILGIDSNMKLYHWARQIGIVSRPTGRGNPIRYRAHEVVALLIFERLYDELGLQLPVAAQISKKVLDMGLPTGIYCASLRWTQSSSRPSVELLAKPPAQLLRTGRGRRREVASLVVRIDDLLEKVGK